MKYEVVRTETADAQIRKIVLYIAENFDNKVALEKLEELEQNLMFTKFMKIRKKIPFIIELRMNLVKINIYGMEMLQLLTSILIHHDFQQHSIWDIKNSKNFLKRKVA